VLARRGPGAVVLDTVYAPRMTPLLIAAERAGCRVIDGLAIFVRQAEAQFAAWTGSPPPPGLFERIAGGDSFGHNTGE
jgi:shikimate 5-dehydrogenase